MPELPEVQTIIDDLKYAGLIGREIQRVHVNWSKTIATDLSTFCKVLPHKTIEGLDRRGKFLVFHLSGSYKLLIHLRMTGRLLLQVFRQTDKPCHRCGHLIQKLKVAQRSTHICPYCQSLHSTERIRGPL